MEKPLIAIRLLKMAFIYFAQGLRNLVFFKEFRLVMYSVNRFRFWEPILEMVKRKFSMIFLHLSEFSGRFTLKNHQK